MCNCNKNKNKQNAQAMANLNNYLIRAKTQNNQDLYNLLMPDEQQQFIKAVYNGGSHKHFLPIQSQAAIRMGLKHYGMGKRGDIVWIHKDEKHRNYQFMKEPEVIVVSELESALVDIVTDSGLVSENFYLSDPITIEESNKKISVKQRKKKINEVK